MTWPDGRSLINQPAVTVDTFALVHDEVRKEMSAQAAQAEATAKRG